jgi:hypothetical protein
VAGFGDIGCFLFCFVLFFAVFLVPARNPWIALSASLSG